MTRPQADAQGERFDICDCGDYRRDHFGGTGACIFNEPGDLCHGMQDCHAFRLFEPALLIERGEHQPLARKDEQ